jgi:hypothetical protein
MDQIRVPSWILWVLCALSLGIAGVLTLNHVGDAQVVWIVCGTVAGLLVFLGLLATYQDNVESRNVAAFRRGEYLAHWIYDDAAAGGGSAKRREAYVGREGVLYDGKFTCWKSVTARLKHVELLAGPPAALEFLVEQGGVVADVADVMNAARRHVVIRSASEKRLRIPVPPGREAEALGVVEALRAPVAAAPA